MRNTWSKYYAFVFETKPLSSSMDFGDALNSFHIFVQEHSSFSLKMYFISNQGVGHLVCNIVCLYDAEKIW